MKHIFTNKEMLRLSVWRVGTWSRGLTSSPKQITIAPDQYHAFLRFKPPAKYSAEVFSMTQSWPAASIYKSSKLALVTSEKKGCPQNVCRHSKYVVGFCCRSTSGSGLVRLELTENNKPRLVSQPSVKSQEKLVELINYNFETKHFNVFMKRISSLFRRTKTR